jgi:spermidine synthase
MTFPAMVEIVPPAKHGIAEVTHFEVSKTDSMFSSLRGGMDYVPAGKYARLRVNGRLMMSDTRMEHATNYEVVRQAQGHVLIAGLGLGMILHPILAKKEVTSVTVIEKYADVIALVGPTVKNDKLAIIEGDIYEWKPAKGTKYSVLYFDIWADQSTDDLEKMKTLHLRFRSYKAKDGWMNSWRRDHLKAQKRRNDRNGWGY